MASTRDKRMKTDSPTPAQLNESSTPTTKASTAAIKLKRMSRSRSGMLSSGKLENEDGNDSIGLSEDTQSSTASASTTTETKEPPKTPNTRPKRQVAREENSESNGSAKEEIKESEKEPASTPTRRLTKAQALKNKAAELAKARRMAMMKRTSLPLPVKASLRNLNRRGSSATPAKGEKEAEAPVTPTKKVAKGKAKSQAEKKDELEPEEKEEEAPKIEADESEKSEDIPIDAPESEITIKQEKLDIQNVRRSTRQRKSTIKDRDSPFTRRSQTRDKSEPKRDSVSPALSTASVKTEKDSAKAISINVDTNSTEHKDPSLSPVLISEVLDKENVQQLISPAFLENNVGIEQDPKLGEIVKVQEITKIEAVIAKEESEVKVEEVEEKPTEQIKEVEDKMEVDEQPEEVKTEEETKIDEKPAEQIVEAPIEAVVEVKPTKVEESPEENKENDESSAKSNGSNSPRSVMSEGNLPKIDLNESAELFKEKVNHFKTLGLLTHKAANEAKLAKIKRKEELKHQMAQQQARKSKHKSSDENKDSSNKTSGTLRTIIKLPRTDKEKRKSRMPLKITFQKKNRDKDSNGASNSSNESFYTIQNEVGNFFFENS